MLTSQFYYTISSSIRNVKFSHGGLKRSAPFGTIASLYNIIPGKEGF